jgi:hypothetical protein
MLARPHPLHGWLWMRPVDWRATLDRLIAERDLLPVSEHGAPAPAFIAWVTAEQLPRLARHPHYRPQIEQRLQERRDALDQLQLRIEAGRLDLLPEVDDIEAELQQLEAWLSDG